MTARTARDTVVDVAIIVAALGVMLIIAMTALHWHEADQRCRVYVAETQLQNYNTGAITASYPSEACGIGR